MGGKILAMISRKAAERALINRLRGEGLEASLSSRKVGKYLTNYVTAGKGPTLLLIHGANIGWGQWELNITELAKDFRVVAIDLPGCGGSTPIDFRAIGLDEYVSVVTGFIRQLDMTTLSIVGHSLGGALAIRLAIDPYLQVRHVVLVDPLGFTRNVPGRQKLVTLSPLAKLLSKTAVRPTRPNMEKFLNDPLVNREHISPALVDYYWTAVRENALNHPILFMHSLTRPFLLRPEFSLANQFMHIKCPTLVIIGDKDKLMPVSKIKQLVADHVSARLDVFAHTGHVPPLEYPEKFNRTVRKFIE